MVTIIGDSSLDPSKELDRRADVRRVPFAVRFDDRTYLDTPTVNLTDFVSSMRNSGSFQSACPSPNDWLEQLETAKEEVFGITISSKLSGSYNSAVLATNLFEDTQSRKIHIFDSKSASTGLDLIARKIVDLKDSGETFEAVVQKVTRYIDELSTMFIINSTNNLRKAGRMSNMKAMMASALNIVPILGAKDGEIELYGKARGAKKAFQKLLDIMEEVGGDLKDRIVAISHSDYESKALELKRDIEDRFRVKEVLVFRMGALNNLYADEAGIIISF